MDRRYIIASLFFMIAAVVAGMLAYPKYQLMSAAAKTADEKQKEFDSQMVLVQDISRLKSQYNAVKEEFKRVNALIPEYGEKSIAALFVELEGLTSRNGVLLESIGFGQNKTIGKGQEKKYRTITASLSLKGDYQNFKNFLRAVETSEHLMDIASISVSVIQEKKEGENEEEEVSANAQQILSFRVEISAYYQ